jgi:D-threo-aldose 1-dehydrogenase
MMETRQLRAGSSFLDVSALGFGGAPLGNLYVAISDQVADETIEAAWDAGIQIFDTAPFYGLGLSEERFGNSLPKYPRKAYVLCTKIGRILHDSRPEEVPPTIFREIPPRTYAFDYSYDGVMHSHADSLKRLKQERIDILLVHDLDTLIHGPGEPYEARVREFFDQGGYRAMRELRDSGVVKAIGAGLNEWQACERMLSHGDFDCFLLASRYTLLEQGALESFLPLCEKQDIGIIIGGPFNSGILVTGAVEGARYDYAPAPPEILERVRLIEDVCQAHGVRLIEAALHFVLAHPAVKTVIPGANSPGQVRANLALLSAAIPPGLWSDLKSAGLLRADAPVPKQNRH